MGLKRGFSDQTSDFDPTFENTVIYRLYVIQNTKVKTNYRNIVVIKNNLYGNYKLNILYPKPQTHQIMFENINYD